MAGDAAANIKWHRRRLQKGSPMNYGTIRFSKVGSDEATCEVPYPPIMSTLVRARLEEAGNHSFDGDLRAVGVYSAFYAAELAGKPVAELPDVAEIRPSDVFRANVTDDFILVGPNGEVDEEDGEGEADENPTGTTGALS